MRLVLPLLFAAPLLAQGASGLGVDPSIQYHFQLRASRAGAVIQDQAGSRFSGGGGFGVMFGQEPLRLRVRMDGDIFPAEAARQRVQTEGLGTEACLYFPPWDTVGLYVSLGPTFQHWEIGGGDFQGQPPRSFNKLAGRVEAGAWFRERVGASIGVLFGSFEAGRGVANPYAAITFHF